MDTEEVARRFQRRSGYELIDCAPVALPLYRLTVDAVTMVHRAIPPIKEFVMRSLAAGLRDPDEVAGFLGLDVSTVHAIFEQLRSERYATGGEEGAPYVLLERGVDVLAKARESSPQDETLVFLWDRLLSKPVRLAPDQVLSPALIDSRRVVEIRPYPAEGPEVGELPMPDVLQVLAAQAGGRQALGRDLLRFKRIVRRVRLFRPGVALVLKQTRSRNVLIEFIVDDARNPELTRVFAERGGPKKMGFLKAIDESSTAGDLRRHLGVEVTKLLPDAVALDEKRLAVSLARIKYQAAVVRWERRAGRESGSDLEESSVSTIDEAAANLTEAERQLREFPARPIAPYELVELLQQALKEARRILTISSRALDASFVDAAMLKALEAALQRGAAVTISLTEAAEAAGPAIDLEKLRSRFPNLLLLASQTAPGYHLVCDDLFAVITNRPFLSNLGKVRSFGHVVGYLLQRRDLVEAFTVKLSQAEQRRWAPPRAKAQRK